MMRSRFGLFGLAAMLLSASCTKDEAAQTADWNRNVENVQKHAAKFPSFKGVFDQRVSDAQKAFDEAKGVSDKSARADAMGAANRTLNDLLPPFDAYDAASKQLSDTIVKHSTLPPALTPVLDSAKTVQTTAAANIAAAVPTNVGEAKAKVEENTAMLKSASDALTSTDTYVVSQKTLADLMADKDIQNLPAAKVNPLMDAAKAAQTSAADQVAKANKSNPAEMKMAVAAAANTLAQAAEPLKALKPAPVATASKDSKEKPEAAAKGKKK